MPFFVEFLKKIQITTPRPLISLFHRTYRILPAVATTQEKLYKKLTTNILSTWRTAAHPINHLELTF